MNNKDFRAAVHLMQNGRLDEAEQLCRSFMRAPKAEIIWTHLLARILFQRGQQNEAIHTLQKAVHVEPRNLLALNDLGNMLQEAGQNYEAVGVFQRLLKQSPRDAIALSNLSVALKQLGRTEEAVQHLLRAVEINDEDPGTFLNLGNAFKQLQKWGEAAAAFEKHVRLSPKSSAGYQNLYHVYRQNGQLDDARDALRRWNELDPDNPVVGHLLAAISDDPSPPRASDEYVHAVFDQFADSFDEELTELGYHVPELIDDVMDDLFGKQEPKLNILDVGCGTGACGDGLRRHANRLTGVDISPRMLAIARSRELYDELIESELTAYMQQKENTFELIASADTFNYFGDLLDVCQAAHAALKENGWFIFSLEKSKDDAKVDFALQPNGRYVHSTAYVDHVLKQSRFRAERLIDIVVRQEAEHPVHGLLIVCQRS